MIAIHRALKVACLLMPVFGQCALAADLDLNGEPLPPGAVARLGTARLTNSGVIHALAYSADGKALLSATDDIHVWDSATGKPIRRMGQSSGSVIFSMVLSPNGQFV